MSAQLHMLHGAHVADMGLAFREVVSTKLEFFVCEVITLASESFFCKIIVSPVLETICNSMLLLANWIHNHAIG